jgi:hypothetical protein
LCTVVARCRLRRGSAVRLGCLSGSDRPQDQTDTDLTVTVPSTGNSTCIIDSGQGVFHKLKVVVNDRPGSQAAVPPSFRLCIAIDSEGAAAYPAKEVARPEERDLLAFTREEACISLESYEQHVLLLKATTGPISILSGRAGALAVTKGQPL